VSVRAALSRSADEVCVLFGDAQQLAGLAQSEGAAIARVAPADFAELAPVAGLLRVSDTGAVTPAVLARHAPAPESGEAQLRSLRAAATVVRSGHARALVTGPTSKAAIVSAGHAFIGQTEFLAALDGRADDDVTMLFLGPTLRVALVTTHLSIAHVPAAITSARVMRTVRHLAQALLKLEPTRSDVILVTGLNPHAGEEGLFGGEERDLITPALNALAAEEPFRSRLKLSAALPAEAVFRAAQRGDAAGVVAMFHDQATIASKLLDWGAAVNTTWGLSFLRTSVDHGVAYDAAEQGSAEHDGMLAALDLARKLTRPAYG
jgi:4-hydroxythreonine-4-phosphate dehydrogenase